MAQRVAIIGGGFSGTLALANLVRQADAPSHIHLFEATHPLAQGVAYSTTDTQHLLNVAAGRMGAFADAPEHFWQWLQSPAGRDAMEILWPGNEVHEGSFVPRAIYGVYLQQVLREAKEEAKRKSIGFHVHVAPVVDVEQESGVLRIHMRGALEEVEADALILATGNLPPRSFAFEKNLAGHAAYVPNIWQPPVGSAFPGLVSLLRSESEVVIIGTGLTAVDAVLTLVAQGYEGRTTLISRHGWLPAAHEVAKAYPAWGWVEKPETAPKHALGLLSGLRREVRKAQNAGYDWRAVVDSLRPVTQTLWRNLPLLEQKKFLRRLFPLWNIHRHRMAPEIAAQLKALQEVCKLRIFAGRVQDVQAAGEELAVSFRSRSMENLQKINAKLLLNCTGPEYDITHSNHILLNRMLERGLIEPNGLRAGLALTEDGFARGVAPGRILPMGTLILGDYLECTAVPELRQQAQQAAQRFVPR